MLHLLGFFLSTLTPEGFYLILLNVSLSSPENMCRISNITCCLKADVHSSQCLYLICISFNNVAGVVLVLVKLESL